MDSWRTIRLEEGLERLIDYRGKSPPKSNGGIPVISAKCVKNGRIVRPIEQTIEPNYYPIWMVRGLPCVGDIVMTTEGPLGEIAQIDKETVQFALGQRVVCMRGRQRILDNTFLKFLLMSPTQQGVLSSYSTGTTVAGISQKSLRSMPVRIPPFDDQTEIGKLLGALDEKIELNRRTNATLEAMARAIFKDWFVDFGPTRAKMEERMRYLASDIWALFPDRLNDEGKPEGWTAGTLGNLADLNPESWSRANYPASIMYVDLSGTKWGAIDNIETHTRGEAPSRAQRVLRPGDTIVGMVRPGNGSYALVSDNGLTGSTGFAVLRPTSIETREFVYLAATIPENIERLARLADGAAYPAVRPEVIISTETVVIDNSVMRAFSSATAPLIDRMETNKCENRTLAASRDLLLPKLMSGEIRIKDAEKSVEAVL